MKKMLLASTSDAKYYWKNEHKYCHMWKINSCKDKHVAIWGNCWKHLLFQSNKKSKHCEIKVNVFDKDFKNQNQFNFNIDNEKLVGVRLLFDNVVLFTSLNNGVETVLRTRILDVSSKFLAPKNIFSEPNKSGYPSFFKLADQAFDASFNVLVELPFQNGKNEDIKLITLDNSLQVINEVYNKLEIKFESKRDNRLLISKENSSLRLFL